MVKVKICGITTLEDARHAIDCGADMLGFNFYEKSLRYIAPANVAEILAKLASPVKSIAVFVNMAADDVIATARRSTVDAIQLHGDETPLDAELISQELSTEVIKAFRVDECFDPSTLDAFRQSAFLLDAAVAGIYGGSGRPADWKVAKNIVASGRTVILAGGLTPENVSDAVRTVKPYAVDVASGVESSPGKKDPKKVREFIRNAKNA